MLQLNPALNLLHHKSVRSCVRMPYCCPIVHWVLLLGLVQEPGAAYAVPHYGEDYDWALPVRRGPACHQPARYNPACFITDIFAPT